MFEKLKIWKLADDLKSKGDSARAFSAVLELGRLGSETAVDQLILALDRRDGVARSAARELGRLASSRAIPALVRLLDDSATRKAAAEALLHVGPRAIEPLLAALRHPESEVRHLAAEILGEWREKRAVDALVEALQTDDTYEVRTSAAAALGLIKDARAVWALVATLKMRDETEPRLQSALDSLRQAATMALRRIGDPLAPPKKAASDGANGEGVAAETAMPGIHPALAGEVSLLTPDELVTVLKEVTAASEEVSWARMENRTPLLPQHFADYEQRRLAAEKAGAELMRRGGANFLREIFERQLGSPEALKNWWADAGLSM